MSSLALKSPEAKKPLDFNRITDWYLPASDAANQKFLAYPGAVQLEGDLLEIAKELRRDIEWRLGMSNDPQNDWRYNAHGATFRVHRQRTVDGGMFMLRRIADERPELGRLGLPDQLVRMLSSKTFGEKGGLVVVAGGTGDGKSTTLAAVLVARVKKHGYFCLTVEHPPEFPLHGHYPSIADSTIIGQIVQVPAISESFALDLRDAMRCYPSNMRGSMLMVGEVRDGDTAAQLLRAAVSGQLVLCTVHASSPVGALERLLTMSKEHLGADEANSLLGTALRAVLVQRLGPQGLEVSPLISTDEASSVAARIRRGDLSQLSSDIAQQATWMKGNQLLQNLERFKEMGGQ
jgi:Tfp pilus assembly pilus retraction ATPase PilT